MNRIIDLFYNIKHFMYRYFIIKYHNVPFYRALFWRLLWQHITKGYDESATWGLYYNIAKWVYPRLLLFYDKIHKAASVPYDYEVKMTKIYIKNGFKYDKKYHRFVDKKVNQEMHRDAINMWEKDVWKMCEAFRDILEEEDDFERWDKGWKFYTEPAVNVYKLLKTDAARKKYWNSLGFDREWYPGINITRWDFAERKRKEGLELFSEHFQQLWW